MTDDIDLMTPKEASNLIHVSVSTLAVWRVKRKNLPYIKIGNKVLYNRPDLVKFIKDRRCGC